MLSSLRSNVKGKMNLSTVKLIVLNYKFTQITRRFIKNNNFFLMSYRKARFIKY